MNCWHAGTEALAVKTTVPITCTPPFPKISIEALALWARGSAVASPRNIARDVPPRGTLMNATFHPQAAAGLRGKNYHGVTNPYTMGLTGTVTAIMALASFAFLAGIVLGII